MIKELFNKQRPLMVTGFGFIVLFVALMIISLFDSMEITGVNRWIKPMKFASSIAIYLLTLVIYLYFISGRERVKNIIGWGAIAMLVGEIILIIMQAARGTTSHFNVQTGAFNSIVFAAMGWLILVNTILIVYLLILYFRARVDLPQAIVWGMRYGIILFLLASVEGGLMSAMLRHSVGVADGGAGLPFVNWSTEGGDLRVAHFIGMHAFQAIPFFAYTMEKYNVKSATIWTTVFAALYFVFFTFLFVQAMFGKPLFAGF
ncbi:MAG: hypothetical protein LC768_17725 [Acidobacteria bacterium]|nr:hypothetical protein [Acidobacteriota bacterium]MCA1640134.1 hypothetical protein [Acidobacteriota bacterium]